MTWTLRIPTAITETRSFDQSELRTAEVHVKQRESQLVIEFASFPDEASAVRGLERAELAMLYASVRHKVGLKWPRKLGTITKAENPDDSRLLWKDKWGVDLPGPLYGLGDGDLPVVYPTGHVVRFATVGSARVALGVSMRAFAQDLSVAAAHPRMSFWLADKPLRLAFEAYATAEGVEGSLPPRVRFLLLVTSVEALIPRQPSHRAVREFANETLARLKERLQQPGDDDERKALNSLAGSVANLRDRSISQGFRDLANAALHVSPHPVAYRNELMANLSKLYGIRSKLVHEHLDRIENQHLHMMQDIADACLTARLETGLGADGLTVSSPTEEQTRTAAYLRWLSRAGDEKSDWYEAEADLRGR